MSQVRSQVTSQVTGKVTGQATGYRLQVTGHRSHFTGDIFLIQYPQIFSW